MRKALDRGDHKESVATFSTRFLPRDRWAMQRGWRRPPCPKGRGDTWASWALREHRFTATGGRRSDTNPWLALMGPRVDGGRTGGANAQPKAKLLATTW